MSYLPTKSNWQTHNQIVTINTPPSKRYYTQQNTVGTSERTTAGTQVNIPNAIESRNKKIYEQYGSLSKTGRSNK